MKQNSKGSLGSIAAKLLPHLRHPTKLRLILCVTIIGGWYVFFFAPLSDQLTETKTLIDKERKRVTIARDIDQLKAKLEPYEKSIPQGENATDLRRHLSDHIRGTPLKLIDLKPGKVKEIGPFDAPALQLSIEGKYTDIDDFLAWVETDQRLLRVDSIRLAPTTKDQSRLLASLTVLGLTDRASTDTPAPATTKKDRSAVPVSSKNVKPSDARAEVSAGTGEKVGEVRKRIGEVRKKVGEVRKNASAAGSSAGTDAKTTTKPRKPE
jgi:Tfp pilus assembly protein PilO